MDNYASMDECSPTHSNCYILGCGGDCPADSREIRLLAGCGEVLLESRRVSAYLKSSAYGESGDSPNLFQSASPVTWGTTNDTGQERLEDRVSDSRKSRRKNLNLPAFFNIFEENPISPEPEDRQAGKGAENASD